MCCGILAITKLAAVRSHREDGRAVNKGAWKDDLVHNINIMCGICRTRLVCGVVTGSLDRIHQNTSRPRYRVLSQFCNSVLSLHPVATNLPV